MFAASEEPLSAETASHYKDTPNLILSPHMAGLTDEALERVHTVTVQNVLRVLSES